MKKILIAVDDTKSTMEIFNKSLYITKCLKPDLIVLVYVEQFEGKSLIAEMLGDAEMATLKEALEGSELKETLDKKAFDILSRYKRLLQENLPSPPIKTVVKGGHAAEEILKTAKEENIDLIIMGARGKRASSLFMGSVSREVSNLAEVPVLIVK
ncbi:MAG: hypothetical protein A2511_05070 [Deltaproteobacteria bacterium RIFOXYD12_FULL_50_9]|nr:MAG: hypothetical protein A2511_05070 [Deltaproteobacteria bacterium RIFOXYD12_FULL_50_9]